ncbi:polysaccharide biosynthesis protein [Marinomonas mediterranea]|uniref:Polysaccharide biosynthesis protein CapD n=1 Tax=Marinomonas mediterranea (strain ATCC 700492 / JCM 21426 / NBRC 103028 / MMB-1) TaxID=717774 RepID=F2K4C4_MARM1|nr:UDP-N-acetylglucosamine 4,6-dehydratase [Marinomonas mediterranea]ADZ92565.1 polysaccharide biosynthesis protein CapD [Marinomonas mediterranea MMB-1]WCN14559.1 polysaccharide biosynthesis protein [Marinomonas mediterranea]WCN18608.1 polysaccharide biosynthesis protein [Marinomonas mediterranea MMB-1]
MKDILELVGRETDLFSEDIILRERKIEDIVSRSSFLVLGASGSIGQAVTKEIFRRGPAKLHVVDISENNIVELVRDLRSEYGYIDGDFRSYVLDVGSTEYEAFFKADGKYDYVLNLSALKHVRSEKDPYTLMRMINVNIFNTNRTLELAIKSGVKKYFCVSTDKAANPVNMMGASKRIMEMFLSRFSKEIDISTARFANVAFSDGSLLYSFRNRLLKKQPIVAPNDVRRYFLTPQESGELCLMSCLFGKNGDVFFPKLDDSQHLITFSEIARRYLKQQGYEALECESESEARDYGFQKCDSKLWPCFFSSSNTTGEKDIEEFFTDLETLDMERFRSIGIVKSGGEPEDDILDEFENSINELRLRGSWSKKEIVSYFLKVLPEFSYVDVGKYLDSKM